MAQCKSVAENLRWAMDMACGAWKTPLGASWGVLSNPDKLKACGFAVSRDALTQLGYTRQDGPHEEQEREWSQWLVSLLVALIGLLASLVALLVAPAALLMPSRLYGWSS